MRISCDIWCSLFYWRWDNDIPHRESDYWLYSNSSFLNRFWCLFYKSFGEHISLIVLPLLNIWNCSSLARNRKPTIRALRHSGKEHVKAASKPTTHHHMRNVFLELRKVSPKLYTFRTEKLHNRTKKIAWKVRPFAAQMWNPWHCKYVTSWV